MTSDTRILTFLRAAVAHDAGADGVGAEDHEAAWRALTDEERDAINAHASLAARNVVPEAVTPTLPPVGTRFGDLSTEQRAALPVGTVMEWNDDGSIEQIRLTDDSNVPWRSMTYRAERRAYEFVADDNTIVSYPEAPK